LRTDKHYDGKGFGNHKHCGAGRKGYKTKTKKKKNREAMFSLQMFGKAGPQLPQLLCTERMWDLVRKHEESEKKEHICKKWGKTQSFENGKCRIKEHFFQQPRRDLYDGGT